MIPGRTHLPETIIGMRVLVALIHAATVVAANLILRKYEITADLIDRMQESGGGSLDRAESAAINNFAKQNSDR